MNKIISTCLIIVGIINFLPVIGVLSAAKLESAYAITLTSNDIVILMRHRALLFGLLGGFIFYSAFHKPYQDAAMIMGAISMLGYIFFALLAEEYNQSIFKIMIIDVIGVAILSIAATCKYLVKNNI